MGRTIQNQTLMVALAILLGYVSVTIPILLLWLIYILPSTVLVIVIAWLALSTSYIALKVYAKIRCST